MRRLAQKPLAFCARTPLAQALGEGTVDLLRERIAPRTWNHDLEIRRVWKFRQVVEGSTDLVAVSRETFAQALKDCYRACSFCSGDVRKLREQLETLCELPANYLDEAKICFAFSSDEQDAATPDNVDEKAFLSSIHLDVATDQLWENMRLEGCVSASTPDGPAQYWAVDGDVFTFALRLVRPPAGVGKGGQSMVVAYTVELRFSGSGTSAAPAPAEESASEPHSTGSGASAAPAQESAPEPHSTGSGVSAAQAEEPLTP
jgi:hypothetical protein